MPTNLPPQAKAAERKYIEAKTLPEKIKYLQEFLSLIPEHKGTEKMRAYLRRRLAQLKEELEEQKKRKTGKGMDRFSIKKEGAAQIAIIGMTKSGKSSLLTKLTNAKSEISDHEFTTKIPIPGMLQYEDIQFQLIDTPAIYEGMENGTLGLRTLNLIRNCDGLIILLDGSNPINQYNVIVKELENAGIIIEKKDNKIEIEVKNANGIQIKCIGKINCNIEEVKKLLRDNGIRNALIKVFGEVNLEDFKEAIKQTKIYKPSLILINKIDKYPNAVEEFKKIINKDVIGISIITGEGLSLIGRALFNMLGIIRVYTKEPNGEIAKKPIVVPIGTKVIDIAKIIHSQFYKNFKYAKVWGASVNYNGERVGAEHILADKDIVEIRIK
ncbi:MAG: GTP-binding protein [Candidatus Methanomethylicota archaeon]|jgi:small GTP-binding protein|uniref:GTP-binding protein n=1 Tax=Thermoproteota archaeon TaxID=2056631 RepID=A0A520KH22_9CREN|nr:MAG: TGS domain-containing protein [Candidatus Verstraetearchaeota archaeon]TDA37979.1 MAG: GTP-binding protein [Candidatus Verstraetearchaeota archaeon]